MNEEEKLGQIISKIKSLLLEEMQGNAVIREIKIDYGIGLDKTVTYEFPL